LVTLNKSMSRRIDLCLKNKGGATKYWHSFDLIEKWMKLVFWLPSCWASKWWWCLSRDNAQFLEPIVLWVARPLTPGYFPKPKSIFGPILNS
jgi:hypothetical protein